MVPAPEQPAAARGDSAAPRSLEGRVLGADEAPLEGVAVTLLPVSWTLGRPPNGERSRAGEAVALTDAAGRFSFPDLASDSEHVLRVVAEHHLPFRRSLPRAEGRPARSLEIRLQPAGSLRGRVIDAQGRALPGTVVAVYRDQGPGGFMTGLWQERDAPFRRIQTLGGPDPEADFPAWCGLVFADETGAYRLSGLPLGDNLLVVAWPDQRMRSESVRFALSASEPQQHAVLSCPPGEPLAGRVIDAAGQPLAGANITLSPARIRQLRGPRRPRLPGLESLRSWRSWTTDADGRFEAPHVPIGGLLVAVEAGAAGSTELRLAPEDPRPLMITLAPPQAPSEPEPALVYGRLRDAKGQPLAFFDGQDFQEALPSSRRPELRCSVSRGKQLADPPQLLLGREAARMLGRAPARGLFVIRGIAGETLQVGVRIGSAERGALTVSELRPGERREVVLSLHPSTLLRGRFVRHDGTPIGAARVTRTMTAIRGVPSWSQSSAVTDQDGRFEFRGLPAPAELQLVGEHGSLRTSAQAVKLPSDGGVVEALVVLPASSWVRVRMLDVAGQPMSGATVLILPLRDGGGQPYLEATTGEDGWTDAIEHAAELLAVAPKPASGTGAVRTLLFAVAAEERVAEGRSDLARAAVRPGDETELVLQVRVPASLEISVTHNGVAVAGCIAKWLPLVVAQRGGLRPFFLHGQPLLATDARGRALIEGFTPQRILVRIPARPYRQAVVREVELHPGRLSRLVVPLVSGALIGQLLSAETNTPIAGAKILVLPKEPLESVFSADGLAVLTDAEGRFRVDRVLVGPSVNVIAQAEGYRAVWFKDAQPLRAGETRDLGVLQAERSER